MMAPLSLIDASGTPTGQTLTGVNKLFRMAHGHAEDKLHYRLKQCFFVAFPDAARANRRDLTSQFGCLVAL